MLLGAPDDPRLPKGALYAVLLSDVYHEIEQPAAVLARLKEALKPGWRLIIVDYLEPSMAGRPRAEQGKKHNIGPEYVERDLKMAGFHASSSGAKASPAVMATFRCSTCWRRYRVSSTFNTPRSAARAKAAGASASANRSAISRSTGIRAFQ